MPTLSLSDYQTTERDLTVREAGRGLRVHATVYAIVIPILITLNLLVVPEFLWFFFPMTGWGIGLTMHYLFGYRRAAESVTRHQERIITAARA
jgi:hypothetical protein